MWLKNVYVTGSLRVWHHRPCDQEVIGQPVCEKWEMELPFISQFDIISETLEESDLVKRLPSIRLKKKIIIILLYCWTWVPERKFYCFFMAFWWHEEWMVWTISFACLWSIVAWETKALPVYSIINRRCLHLVSNNSSFCEAKDCLGTRQLWHVKGSFHTFFNLIKHLLFFGQEK